jgi:mono/diheme cytochrome c family protein
MRTLAKLLTRLLLIVGGGFMVISAEEAGARSNLDAAREDYLLLCADCHGRDAKGNGPTAKNLSKNPPDLTKISTRAGGMFDERKVFDWILGLNMPDAHGDREMPIWGDWLMDEAVEDNTSLEAADAAARQVEQRVMALVHYLRSLQNP